MKFLRGKMGMLIIFILIIMKGTVGLTWNTEMMASVCCQGNNQFLIWNFTEGENERVTELHWYFNEKTVVCLVSTSTGFFVTDLYKGRVEQNGIAGILLKNVSLNDTGEYTLYVKLEEEKEPNVQGINLTVVEPPPNQCKPIIKKEHPKGIISCSTSCERSPLSIEWIINGTKDTGDIGPYFVVNSSGTSEQPICCLRDFKCLDDYQTKFCTRNNISFTEDMHTVNESFADTNHMVYTPILILLSVIQIVLINVVIAYVILNRRRCRLFPEHHYARTDDKEIELEEPLSVFAVPERHYTRTDDNEIELEEPLSESRKMKRSFHRKTDLRKKENRHKYSFEKTQVKCSDFKNNDTDTFKTSESEDAFSVAVEPTHSNTVVQCNEDLQQGPTEAATTAETVNLFSKDQEPDADFNDVQVPEKPSPMLRTVKDLDTDLRHDEIQEMISAMLKKLQEVEANLKHIQEQESRKLKRQLHQKTDLRKKENRQIVIWEDTGEMQ